MLAIPKIDAGGGRISLSCHGSAAVFSELSSTYPLKLLSPRIPEDGVAVVYILTYGGGLVSGDRVNLSVDVGEESKLVLLSQGSTKVFKTRPGHRLASVQTSSHPPPTTQIMTFVVNPNASLFLLPDPVTCFRSASYNQIQTFRLTGNASAVILDWVTSGRRSLGEEWVFSRYYSVNEILVDGKRIAKDAMLLDDPQVDVKPLPERALAEKLKPYSCYATLFLVGPQVQAVITELVRRYHAISIMKMKGPDKVIWSLSPLTGNDHISVIVRVAGKETEDVKAWLGKALESVQYSIGKDVYRQVFR
ncbi:UreD-domain-containing protein [Guyanagaster necrorhizus]|uniref:UreD-domain-containing protein n=1 Tax=Guyanagaster necrorhizus TaxID=856835 RepID=A0A9P8AWS8_9AGAR|nr:UreD-domain-containing protein [Guyanagaster necrorhizus MCA 3950]KAG7450650.1 UreD-domain-containing protein [Guyanagaster necrorhizus MCA 3950]